MLQEAALFPAECIVYEDDDVVVERRLVEAGAWPVPYLVSRPRDGESQPVIWEKGFNNGCDDKLPLARAFARHGYGMIAVGQNRRAPIGRDPLSGYPDAIGGQAEMTLRVMEAEGLQDKTTPLVGFSMGGTVAAAMVAKARQRQWRCFDTADIVLLAPSGVIPRDSLTRLSLRGLHDTIRHRLRVGLASSSEMLADDGMVPADFGMLLLQNPLRALREIHEISARRIRLVPLAQNVGSVAVGVFAHDHLVPARSVGRGIRKFFDDPSLPDNISYFTPYSSVQNDSNGGPLGARNARHIDPFLNPSRVVDATVAQLR